MSAKILNLPAYAVIDFRENEHDYHITARSKQRVSKCRHCLHTGIDGFGHRQKMVRDLPMRGKRVGLYIDTRRYRCKACRKTFYESLPGINDKRLMTNRLVDWVCRQAVKRTFASVAEDVGIVEGTVRLIFKDFLSGLNDGFPIEAPKWMGIGEINLVKPRAVVADIQNNTIVELLPSRSRETIIHYLSSLNGRDQVQYVAMDMWPHYKEAVEAIMPQACIVIDKLHVVKMTNEAFERVRKNYRQSLTQKQRRSLTHDRLVMLKREDDLSDAEALLLAGWLRDHPELGLAYRIKEDFLKIYDAKTKEEALIQFADWSRALTPEARDDFSDLITAWRNWQPYILAYFEHPVTNDYTESLNGLLHVIGNLGRGYSFDALRVKLLFAESAFKKQQKLINNKLDKGINCGVNISILTHMIANGEI